MTPLDKEIAKKYSPFFHKFSFQLGDVPTGVGIWIPQEEGQKHIEIGHGAELKKVITQIGEDMKLHCVRAEDQMFEVYAAVEVRFAEICMIINSARKRRRVLWNGPGTGSLALAGQLSMFYGESQRISYCRIHIPGKR